MAARSAYKTPLVPTYLLTFSIALASSLRPVPAEWQRRDKSAPTPPTPHGPLRRLLRIPRPTPRTSAPPSLLPPSLRPSARPRSLVLVVVGESARPDGDMHSISLRCAGTGRPRLAAAVPASIAVAVGRFALQLLLGTPSPALFLPCHRVGFVVGGVLG
uniref:Uncharacterized protein n=1 Tax=Hordeum vulgare subsp. vulgare TaxID=112509 RepID=A0A8I6Z5I2_HORVV